MMKMQTFRAPHMMAALEEVQKELGPDALIVSVREIPPGPAWQIWRRPGVEVVVASEAQNGPTVADPGPRNRPADIPGRPANGHGAVAGPAAPAPATPPPTKTAGLVPEGPDLAEREPAEAARPAAVREVHDRLAAQGLDGALLDKIIRTIQSTLPPHKLTNRPFVRDSVRHQLKARLRVAGPEARGSRTVICLVGPSGAGKTGACGKLAAEAVRARGQKVAWICADTVKTGAIAEAQVYADILEIPLFLAHDPQELTEVLDAAAEADLILVDTFSCHPWQETAMVELGAFLTVLPPGAIYLTAPATQKAGDLAAAWGAFGMFDLAGLVVTKLDETEGFGDIFNLAYREKAPLSYFTTGPRVLEDLQPASADALVAYLLGP